MAVSGPSSGGYGPAARALYAIIGLHVATALYHHFVRRDQVLRRMLSGVPG